MLLFVIRKGSALTALGLALGLQCALFGTRVLSNLLYAVETTGPASFLMAAVVFAVVAMLACFLPAQRASRVDPNVTLRYE